jgi:hypothetical protein
MACADWCDARAYCAWAGKRLCGGIGGGTIDFPKADYSQQHLAGGEFYNACSQGGKTKYPYGDDGGVALCKPVKDQDGIIKFQPIGSAKACHGIIQPFDQLQDMVGNVEIWENRCRQYTDAAGTVHYVCGLRGGITSADPGSAASVEAPCDALDHSSPVDQAASGIRCCADTVAAP